MNSTPKRRPSHQRTRARPTDSGESEGSRTFISRKDPDRTALLLDISQPGTDIFRTTPSPTKASLAKMTGNRVSILLQYRSFMVADLPCLNSPPARLVYKVRYNTTINGW